MVLSSACLGKITEIDMTYNCSIGINNFSLNCNLALHLVHLL